MKIYRMAEQSTLQDPINSENEQMDSSDVICPFCKEKDFDLIGLKGHLMQGDCEVFNRIEIRPRWF
jgi:hypothetical protein